MSDWSYSGDPSKSDRDAVRFTIGDTDPCDKQMNDKEIDYLISVEGAVRAAAATAAEILAAKYARLVDEAVGAVRQSLNQRFEHYKKLADRLKSVHAQSSAMAYAGGISKADKEEEKADTDRVKPAFTRELHDNPETIPPRDLFDEN